MMPRGGLLQLRTGLRVKNCPAVSVVEPAPEDIVGVMNCDI